MDENMQQAPQQGQPQQQQPQPDVNPSSVPPVAQMLANYRAQMEAVKAQAKSDSQQAMPDQNPFAPDQANPQDLAQQKAAHQAWLSTQPVSAQNQMAFDKDAHNNYVNNLHNDAAVKEILPNFDNTLQTLRHFVESGKITPEQALQHFQEASPMIEAAVDKYHGEHSPSQHMSMLDDVNDHHLAMQEYHQANAAAKEQA